MPGRAPQLEGQALAAVRHRSSHMQIIASAGSEKTEVVSQRVADLLVTDVPACAIVTFTFTFTERAAEDLKNRRAAEPVVAAHRRPTHGARSWTQG